MQTATQEKTGVSENITPESSANTSGNTNGNLGVHLDLSPQRNLQSDLPAGLVVFLVALPLCLGIALASGAPLIGGVISGIIGGIVVAFVSGSELSVSGPAAGLTVIVAAAITSLGSYQNFLTAVVLSGALQLVFSIMRAGILGDYVPSSVIRGMLSAIGVVIILKQIPHALGRDTDFEGDFSFLEPSGHTNTITEIMRSVASANPEALIITGLSLAILLLWERPRVQSIRVLKMIPAPLLVVVLGIVLNESFRAVFSNFYLRAEDGHLVQLPLVQNPRLLLAQLHFPNFAALLEPAVYTTALTLAIVASLETLLSLEAVDKLDPYKRISDANKELRAQGIGNIISGMLGGLPMTSVIVRSSANVYAGGRTRMAAVFHGVLLLVSVVFLASVLNLIPLASLASILIVVGYKLTPPKLYRQMYAAGREQFFPFIVTVVAIVFTDLLTGIAIGLCLGMFFVIRSNHQLAVTLVNIDNYYLLRFTKDMTFINKNELKAKLRRIPSDTYLLIDGSKARFIDADIYGTIAEFAEAASFKNIQIEYKSFEAKIINVSGGH
ncbi:MAG: SulP family inorganic anion transporter [Candidatus Kapaibacterium sp.]|nr:MAG: SulP family inorganic anion transporter [Candidatus Kapabacteria bacterium]